MSGAVQQRCTCWACAGGLGTCRNPVVLNVRTDPADENPHAALYQRAGGFHFSFPCDDRGNYDPSAVTTDHYLAAVRRIYDAAIEILDGTDYGGVDPKYLGDDDDDEHG